MTERSFRREKKLTTRMLTMALMETESACYEICHLGSNSCGKVDDLVQTPLCRCHKHDLESAFEWNASGSIVNVVSWCCVLVLRPEDLGQ